MKFGGTSVRDADAMRNVARIVTAARPNRPVVVISAVAEATNTLESIGRKAASGEAEAARALASSLLDRHTQIASQLKLAGASRSGFDSLMTDIGATIDRVVTGVAALRECTPRAKDALCSCGELLSSRLVAAVLAADAVWLDTRDFMLTDDRHGRARPLAERAGPRTRDAFGPVIASGRIPVTQGFIGVTSEGERTTMGRESSDYTAAVLGDFLDAARIEIWTDVQGVLTGDPRMVQNPRLVERLSFAEAFELSYFGAKVLHPSTMIPAESKGIPIAIRSSIEPGKGGTLIGNPPTDGEAAGAGGPRSGPRSVALRPDVVQIELKPPAGTGQYLFRDQLYEILIGHGIEAILVNSTGYATTVILGRADLVDGLPAELERIGGLDVTTGLSVATIVGQHFAASPEFYPRLLKALPPGGGARLIHGASGRSLNILLNTEDATETVRRIHTEFFGGR
jgi:aspartate kinase